MLDDRHYTYDISMFRDTFENDFTYLNGFLRNTHRYADRTALTCYLRNRQWTYRALNEDCNRLAHALIKDGVGKADIVMYQLYNCAEWVFIYLAPQKIGAINCPINFRLSYGETATIIDDSKPKVFFYDGADGEAAEKALNTAQHKPKTVVMVDTFGTAKPFAGAVSFEDYVRDQPHTNPDIPRPTHIYDEVTRLYTSGTTGRPKGVPLNNINEIFSAHDVIMHFPLSPRDKTLNMTPWFHRGGLYAGGPNPTLYVGGELVPLRHFDAATVVNLTEEHGLSFLIGAPVTLSALADEQQKKRRDLSRLKGIVTMGAPLERAACIRFQEVLTPNIFNGYGSTEAFWNTFLRPYDLPEMAGSAGRSCTDDDMAVVKVYPDRLAEPDDHVAKDGNEVGEVIVRAAGKCSFTYVNRPEDAKAKYYKGWLYIGDLCTWNEEEFMTVVGRKDDMFISGGENIHPVQVEAVLNEHPQVINSLVVGMPDPKWGQMVVAYVIKSDGSLTAKGLDEFCLQHPMLANYKRPRYYRFVDTLPMTATGKLLHYKAKVQVQEDALAGLFEKV
ncbi:AMP-binding protein [Geotalea sp. SG265]|uniref:class I adenylate-forming enzyme family protein n=1 Tax=Geotalea sp. SG265 TaxID=2922867 RepID=UPI001FAEF1A7|nr:AMP-binding protein [Geotalea sp. SG265]